MWVHYSQKTISQLTKLINSSLALYNGQCLQPSTSIIQFKMSNENANWKIKLNVLLTNAQTQQYWWFCHILVLLLTTLSKVFNNSSLETYKCCTGTSSHVNQPTRWRLFSREIIVVRDIRRRRSLVILFLPCWAIKRSHSGRGGGWRGCTKKIRGHITRIRTNTCWRLR